MEDTLEYWQEVLDNAKKHLEIMDAKGIEDMRSRVCAKNTMEEAEKEISKLL
jgi:hypothetical protein